MNLPKDLGTDQVTKPETITKTETLVNLQRQAQQFEATLTSPAGMTGTVTPVNGTVESLNQVPITLTFDSDVARLKFAARVFNVIEPPPGRPLRE